MARTGVFHHIGTFLLFAAAILLLITTISSPVVNHIGLLKVKLQNSETVSFGTFGYCTLASSGDVCSKKMIGYSPMKIMESIDSASYSSAARNTADGLTRVQILHPIACGLAFIAFLFALGAGICGALFASAIAAVAWVITLVVMVTDFVAWGIVKDHVNDDKSGSHATFSTAMWTILVAMICLFFATFIVLFTCFSARRHERRNRVSKHETQYVDGGYAAPATTTRTRRHFWQRSSRY